MWYVLVVILFGSDPADAPKVLPPAAFTSEAKCKAAGLATLQAIKDAHVDSIAAVALACKQMSNPDTEKEADR